MSQRFSCGLASVILSSWGMICAVFTYVLMAVADTIHHDLSDMVLVGI